MTNLNSLQKCNGFNFVAEHNGIPCVISARPEDQGTEQQVWFTRQMLCDIYGVKSLNTIDNHVEALLKRGVVTDVKNLTSVMMPDSLGRECVKTTLFDLKVFNYLAMRLDTDRAWEVKEKFNDILVKEETLKEESKENTLPAVSKEDHLFLNILHAENKEQTALALKDYKTYRDDIQRKVEQERDEAIRTKAFISSKREATLMGKVGGTTKALNFEREKNTKLLKENVDLIKEKEVLKIRLQESDDYKTVRQMTPYLEKIVVINKDSLKRVGKEMTRLSKEMFILVKQVDDIVFKKVNSYKKIVWKEFFIKLNNDPLFLIDIRK